MLIEHAGFAKSLSTKTVLLTGGGGGIGFEAARALCYLGAKVIIAEIDRERGRSAEQRIREELGEGLAVFYEVDLSSENQIDDLAAFALRTYGFVDVIFNNATLTPIGAVDKVPIDVWDKSYAVNFRAPLLLTQKFLPLMKQKNSGTIVFVPSSGAAPYMGAYEVFKTTQVELCNTLAGELEDTGVVVFSIGPGLVKTETAQNAIRTISKLMGMSIEEFYAMNDKHLLSAEEAGTGFALSIVHASKYNGREISSIQALVDAGVYANEDIEQDSVLENNKEKITSLINEAVKTLEDQYDGWVSRNVFERQWVFRDFKKTVGESAEQFLSKMQRLKSTVSGNAWNELPPCKDDFKKLHEYYEHQYQLLQGYEKNPQKLKESSDTVLGWLHIVRSILDIV